ncbi:MAG: transcription elongation factor GreA [Chitinophagales bacterium]|jgi:transcription elongation factor GreA|nr:transcription elongation factor GreA [Chitinophagaceae bacterium]MBP9881955.1 transcription elongation factor GreA [Chitinophagales bacterium]
MAETTYLTAEGLEKLKKELIQMRTKGRAEIARQIQEAREKGDLSENAEYDAAKDAQGMLEMKISKLEEALSNARVIDTSKLDTTKVMVLSKVKVKNISTKQTSLYMLVSEKEADFKTGKISVSSPIGKGFLGKSVGDVAEIEVPSGKMKFEIIEISL